MKKILRFLTLTLIFAFIIFPMPFQGGGQGVVIASQFILPLPTPTCDTFSVDNESSHALGEVVVSDGFSDYADFDVTGSGLFDQYICFTASTVTVNGVAIPMPTSRNVQLATGSWVNVAWKSSSLVEVNDAEGADGERRY